MTKKNKQNNKKAKGPITQFLDRNVPKAKTPMASKPMENLGKLLGRLGGNTLGMGGAGAYLGKYAGRAVGWITGTGDYQTNFSSVSQNVCTIPSFSTTDSTVIVHREYIQDIVSGTGTPSAFDIQKFPLNPGVTSTFPWLAQLAANYEEYDILGMVFEFNSTSGESVASTNTALGTVIMATEYDPTKPAFASKQQMENYSFASSFKPSSSFLHAVECKKDRTPVKQLYVRDGSSASTGTDLRWTDFGNFFIATQGCPAAGTTLGELWVTFKVKLIKPRLPTTVGGIVSSQHTYRTSCVTANPFGTISAFNVGSLGVTFTGTTMVFSALPQQKYLIHISWLAATSVTTAFVPTVVGLQILQYWQNDTLGSFTAGNGTTNCSYTILVQATGTTSAATVTYTTPAVTIVGAASCDIFVSELDSTIVQ